MSSYTDKKSKAKHTCSFEKGDKRFASGVAVLTLSTVVVKIIGVVYKIPMMKILGQEGMGYFNSAYEIYTLFYILATAGLPVAVSILIASSAERNQYRNVKRIYGVSMAIFVLMGIIFSCIMYFGAEKFSLIIENSNAFLCILAISPMALFICVSSAVRGYFQGLQNMVPTAVSQIIEAGFKLLLGLLLASYAIKSGYDYPKAAALATLGLSAACGISSVYLLCSKLSKKAEMPIYSDFSVEKKSKIARNIINIAIPITVSSVALSITRVVDLVMIMRRLQTIGYSESAANAIYGSYSTLALSMFNLPASFVTPIGLSLVPVLTSAIKSNNKFKEISTVNSALRLCGLITIPASLGLSFYSRPILELVFHGETNAVKVAAPLLSCLAISVFFSCIMSITNSILQSYGKEKKPIVSMLIGSGVKIVSSYILIGIPKINIYGAPISTFLCVLTVSAINISYVKKCNPDVDNTFRLFSKSLLAAVISVAFSGIAYVAFAFLLGESAALTLAFVALTVVLFAFLALKLKAIDENDIKFLPRGERICFMLKKIKLI